MTHWLFYIALLFQSLDAYTTCYGLNHGHKELNPLYGNTCLSSTTRHAALFIPYTALPSKWAKRYSIMLIGSGGIGISLNLYQINK